MVDLAGGGDHLAKHTANVIDTKTVDSLLSTLAQARAFGQLAWDRQKPNTLQGRIEVATAVADCSTGALRIYVATPRPDRIHVQYLINGVALRRLDVNDDHRGLPPGTTHKHKYVPQSGQESFYVPKDIPAVPLGPTVAAGTYRKVFEAFAFECFIELPDGYWTEPGR
jgi:hypothetical protein